MAAFAVTGLVLVVLLFAAALVLASAHEEFGERLRVGAPTVKRWGGHVLIAVGVWLIVLAAFAGTFARVFPV